VECSICIYQDYKRERSIEDVKEVFLEFLAHSKTGIGHGTDIAGMLG
jgi:L-serine dehydratase